MSATIVAPTKHDGRGIQTSSIVNSLAPKSARIQQDAGSRIGHEDSPLLVASGSIHSANRATDPQESFVWLGAEAGQSELEPSRRRESHPRATQP